MESYKRRLALFVFAICLVGCGGGGGTGSGSGGGSGANTSPPPTKVPAGVTTQFATVLLNSVLERAVPSAVSQIRLSGFNSSGQLVYGPDARPKSATIVFTQVPLTVSQIQVEYLDGTFLYGIARVKVVLSPNETMVLSDLDFEETEAVVTSFSIEPGNLTLAQGTSGQLRAVAQYSDGSVLDLTQSARWESGSLGLSVNLEGLVESHSQGQYQVTAVFGTFQDTVPITVTSAVLESLRIEPPALELPIGAQSPILVRAIFSDRSQQDVTPQVSLSLSPPNLAGIETSGQIRALTQGQGTLTATYESLSSQATISVTKAALERIEVSPANPELAKGSSQRFVATGHYTDQSSLDLSDLVVWSVSNSAVFSLDATGLGTGVALGDTEVRATLGPVQGATNVAVTDAVLERLTLIPNTTLPVGLANQLTLLGHYSDGTTLDLTELATYSSEDKSVATVTTLTPRGLVTARAEGTTSVTALYRDLTALVEIRVTPAVLETLTVAPVDRQLPDGLSLVYTAQGDYSDGIMRELTSQVTWTSSAPLVAQIDGAGQATALSQGVTVIEANLGVVSGSTQLTVIEPKILSLRVFPDRANLLKNETFQLQAEAELSDGSLMDVSNEAVWTSDSEAVISVDQTGKITGLQEGEGLITASLNQTSGSSRIKVIPSGLGEGFFPAVNFGQMSSYRMEVGDLNGDGFQDAATVRANSGTIELLFNDGDGLLKTSSFLETGSERRLQDIKVGDLNGDQKPDLVVTDSTSRKLLVYLNQGAASFLASGEYSLDSGTFVGVDSLFLLDADGDGDLDMLGLDGGVSTGRLSLFRNNGSGVFGSAENTELQLEQPYGHLFFDVDGINGPDLVWYARTEGDLYAELNDGSGGFGNRITLLDNSNLSRFQVLDIDLDGDPDLVVSQVDGAASEKLIVYRNTGSYAFETSETFRPGPYLAFATPEDVDGDGYKEILAYSLNTNQLYVFFNNGDGTFELPINLRGETRDLQACDLDNDGDLDLVYEAGLGVSVHFNRGGTFLNAPTVLFSNDLSSPAAGDFDKDGDLDVVVLELGALDGFHHILLNDGKGNFSEGPGTFRAGNSPNGTLIADFNEDGNLDLAIVNSSRFSNSFTIILGNGDGTFQNRRDFDAGGLPTSLVKGDFNLDSHVDLAFLLQSQNEAVVFFNNGNAQFTKAPTNFPAGDNPVALRAADVDGDSDIDLITTTAGDFRVAVLKNQGAGTFAAPVLYNTGEAYPRGFDVADIDGDNDLDLAVTHSQRPTVLMLNNGNGEFSAGTSFPDGRMALFGDVDQDGDLDLLTDGLRMNDGHGNFGEPTRFFVGETPFLFGDFDLDGDVDLAGISYYRQFYDMFFVALNVPFPARD